MNLYRMGIEYLIESQVSISDLWGVSSATPRCNANLLNKKKQKVGELCSISLPGSYELGDLSPSSWHISILSQVLNIPVSAFFDENIAADQLNQQTEVGKVSNKRTLMPKINCRHYEPVQENDLDEIKKANNVKGRKERKKRPAKEQKAKQRQGELKNMILLSTIQNSISKK